MKCKFYYSSDLATRQEKKIADLKKTLDTLVANNDDIHLKDVSQKSDIDYVVRNHTFK